MSHPPWKSLSKATPPERMNVKRSDNQRMSQSCWCALTRQKMSLYVEHMACCLLLVPCALLSIVCPLPSCYPIIVSVASPVSPSFPSFVPLYCLLVSAVLRWSVVFHRLCVMLTALQFSACLPVFPLQGVFCLSLLYFVLKTRFPCILSPHHLSLLTHPDRTDQPIWGLSRGRVCVVHHPPLSPAPYANASSSSRPWAPAVSRAMMWGSLPWSSVVQQRG